MLQCSNLINGLKVTFVMWVFVAFLVPSNFILATAASGCHLFIVNNHLPVSFTSTMVTCMYILILDQIKEKSMWPTYINIVTTLLQNVQF